MIRLIKNLNIPKETSPVLTGENSLKQSHVASQSLALLAFPQVSASPVAYSHACVCECDWEMIREVLVRHRVFLSCSYVTKLPLTANAASQRNYLEGHTMQRFSIHLLTAMSSFNVDKPPNCGRCAYGRTMPKLRRVAGSGCQMGIPRIKTYIQLFMQSHFHYGPPKSHAHCCCALALLACIVLIPATVNAFSHSQRCSNGR